VRTQGPVRRWTDGGIAVIEIDRPPVNALAHPARVALLQAILETDADPGVKAIIILGAGRHFIAGSDLREFDADPLQPLLNDVLLRLEACSKPVVAALHGTTLGGGFELALACHYRCAAKDLSVGLPEITYGLLPGAGGTQRLPRLINVGVALDMMLSGKPVDADRAHELGIVDELLDGPVLDGALGFARALIERGAGAKRLRERDAGPPPADPAFFSVRAAQAARDMPGLLAPAYICECVEAAFRIPFEEALALSRRRFEECRVSTPSRALRHLFFAERTGGSHKFPAARDVSQVAVIGAGTMGSGIAISLSLAGFEVCLIDPQAPALQAGLARIKTTLEASAAKGRLSTAQAAAAFGRVSHGANLEDAAMADLVIEAVFENLAVKRQVFEVLDRCCARHAVLATNTSTLDVDAIAAATHRAGSVVGMHFFSPANVMRLVEIVKAKATRPDVIETVMAVVRRMRKLGVVVGNGHGFVGNRMLYAYGRENQLMLLEGASPLQIDRALKGFGMAMGPNAVGDLAGLDVGYRARREGVRLSNDPRYYRAADVLVEAGRLGQKTGRGAFRYAEGSREPLPDPEAETLIEAEAARLGVSRRSLDDSEIVDRCILALINAGAELLATGIAASSSDIDAIWCNGYGFPRYRGGPMFYADTMGLAAVTSQIESLARRWGVRDWTPSDKLRQLVACGQNFAEADEVTHD
jgi:3-hydroxyacyl-CoA dehydrogenase